jgi:hypothetical protein
MTTPIHWQEPQSFDEADERVTALIIDARLIEAQLADHNRMGDNGQRLADGEYWSWRRKATYALAAKRGEIDLLKQWRRQKQQAYERLMLQRDFSYQPNWQPLDYLRIASQLLSLLLRGDTLDKTQQIFVDHLRDYLREELTHTP